MFKVFESEASGRIFKKFYCEGKFEECVRFKKSAKGENVPDTLLPNGSFVKL